MPPSSQRPRGVAASSRPRALAVVVSVGRPWLARLAVCCVALPLLGCGAGPEARRDVLLLTVDTLRADFLHSYGFPQDSTPEIDALAARGALFERAVAASTATVPSHASIMTSRYVREHSVGPWNGATKLAGAVTLAERFREAGYDTAAFVSNVVLQSRSGLDQGFDHYDDELPESEPNRGWYFERRADETAARAIAWLETPRERPFFVWVHLQDPHGPYTPPPPFSERFDELPFRTGRELPVLSRNRGRGGIPSYQALPGIRRGGRYAALYAGEIAFTDVWVGRIARAAEAASGSRGLVLLFTADHGESLDEAGFFFQHGHATTPEQARVPLVLVAPQIAPRRVAEPVSHVDVAPTLLELAGLEPLADASGISLVPYLEGGEALPRRMLFSDIGREVSAYDRAGFLTVRVLRPEPAPGAPRAERERALREQRLDWQRYDFVSPPADREGRESFVKVKGDEGSLPAPVADYLQAEVPTVPAVAMSEEDAARLRALGYLPPAEEADAPAADAARTRDGSDG